MNKKLIIILMIVLLGSLSVYATGGKEPLEPAAVTDEGPVDYYMKFDPVIKLTQPMTADDGKTYPEGDDVNSNVFTRWCEKEVGIKWEAKYTYSTSDESKQKLSLAMASNDLPDLLFIQSPDIAKLAKAGLIIPIKELQDKYQSPIGKYMLEENDRAMKGHFYDATSYNGQAYAVPWSADTVVPNNSWYRKDILDELGLDVPETIADLDEAFQAYKAINPEGVGLILDKSLVDGMNMIMDAYGAYPKRWVMDSDGKLAYGSIQPGAKEALAKLRDWYAKGYLDREFVVKDVNKAEEVWKAGNALVLEGAWWKSWGTNITLYQNVPTMELAGGSYLLGPDGNQGPMIELFNKQGFVISSQCEHPEAIIILFNHYLDSAFRGHKDLQDKFDFIYPYEQLRTPINLDEVKKLEAEGKVAFKKYDYEKPGPRNGSDADYFNTSISWSRQFGMLFNQRASQLTDQFLRIADAWEAGKIDELSQQDQISYTTMFRGIDTLRVTHFGIVRNGVAWRDQVHISGYNGPPTPTMISGDAYLKKIELETFANIILGESPLSAFDKFVEEWKRNGGDDITAEVNEWYSSMQ